MKKVGIFFNIRYWNFDSLSNHLEQEKLIAQLKKEDKDRNELYKVREVFMPPALGSSLS